jgi:hypothetical protein
MRPSAFGAYRTDHRACRLPRPCSRSHGQARPRATALDADRRAAAITKFLKDYPTSLSNAANNIVATGTAIADITRLQAFGQFAEKMSALRNVTIDLSKIDSCKSGLQNPVLRTAVIKDTAGTTTGTYYIPTDQFVICYEQAWQQMLPAANDVITAATQYDTLADVSSGQLKTAVVTIQNNIGKLDQPNTINMGDLLAAAGQLVTYGQAVIQALSPTNVTTVQTDVNNVTKLFGAK